MSIANLGQSAPGLGNLDTTVLPALTAVMKQKHHQLVIKSLVGAVIALGAGVMGAAPAGADKTPVSTEPKPFGTLSCDCQETATPGSPARRREVARGVQQGLSTSLTGPPRPADPRQPRS